jgi:NAD(P)-dependent dehydrogenase (short-subunit alcohol dehydrogenase family)
VTAATAKFGRVDVLVNNAGNFYAGFFEELSPEQVRSQGGDPAKLANALVRLAALHEPPARFAAGADALQTFEAKAEVLLSQANAHRVLSASLAFGSA